MDDLTSKEYSGTVASAFDAVAPSYDAFENSNVVQEIRQRIYGIIDSLLHRHGRILDINCGTGTDACALSLAGYDVTGLDISPRMIEQARAKGAQAGCTIPFFVGSYTELNQHVQGTFDLVLSNLGGLNCTKDLHSVARTVAAVTRPHGHFLALVMPPFALWETINGLVHGNLSLATRRWKGSAPASSWDAERFTVFYHSLSTVRRTFAPFFQIEHVMGIAIVSPPPHPTTLPPLIQRALLAIDRAVGSLPLLRTMGDHTLILLRRTNVVKL